MRMREEDSSSSSSSSSFAPPPQLCWRLLRWWRWARRKGGGTLALGSLLLLNVIAMVGEIATGVLTSHHHLLSHGCHMLFDCLALFVSLAAMIMASNGGGGGGGGGASSPQQTKSATVAGTGERYEVLAAFTNSVLLLFVSLFMSVESLHQLVDPSEAADNCLLTVATQRVVLNVASVFVYQRFLGTVRIRSLNFFAYMAHVLRGDSRVRGNAHEANVQVVLLHLVLDICSSVGAILTRALVDFHRDAFYSRVADPAVLLASIGLVVHSTWPICRDTARVLLWCTPREVKGGLDTCVRKASTVDGVLECYNERFYAHAPGVNVGAVHVRVRADACERHVREKVHDIFGPFLQELTVQVTRDASQDWLLLPRPGDGDAAHASGVAVSRF